MTSKYFIASNVKNAARNGLGRALLIGGLVGLVCAPLRAQTVGEEFTIAPTGGYTPVVAAGGGNVVVMWPDDLSPHCDLFAQRYDASGARLGPQFQVNDSPAHCWQVERPALAVGRDGRFAAFWRDGSGMVGRVYDPSGVPIGTPFVVSPDTISPCCSRISAAVRPDGSMVVVWRALRNEIWTLVGQRLDSDGMHLGSELHINVSPISLGAQAAVSSDANGNFVVVWDAFSKAIMGRRFTAAGIAGAELAIDLADSGDSSYSPTVAAASSGSFVAAWKRFEAGSNVFARRYSSLGEPIGPRFQVNTAPGAYTPAVSIDSGGKTAVTWFQYHVGDIGIRVRWYTPGGNAIGNPFPVSTSSLEREPSVAATGANNFMAVWGRETDDSGRYWDTIGRRLRIPTDLVVSDFSAPAGTAPGAWVEMRVMTSNQGGAPAAPTLTEIRWSTDATLDSSDPLLAGPGFVPGLKEDRLAFTNLNATLPDAPGVYYLFAVADSSNAVVEASETNNTSVRTVIVGPDLVISALSAPPVAFRGSSITIFDVTANAGGSSSAATRTRVVLSRDGVLSGDDITLGDHAVAALLPSAAHVGVTIAVLPASLAPGTYVILAVADPHDDVSEAKESNNRRLTVIMVL